MTRTSLPLLVFGCLSLIGCTLSNWDAICEEGSWREAPPEETQTSRSLRVAEVLPVEHAAIDLLFVIDDSRSMSDEQEQLGRWSSELFNVLSLEGELPDLHLAVISSSLTIPGVEGCFSAGDGRFHVGQADLGGEAFLRDVAENGERARNYQGTLTETFAAMAKVGEVGCGFEQPFEATRRALDGGIAENDGFLRDEALLVVVFVTDEDDCSATSGSLFSDPYADSCSPLGTLSGFRCFEFGVRCYDGKGARELGERSSCRPDEDSAYIRSVSSFAKFVKRLKDHPGKVVVAGVYGKPHEVVVEKDFRYAHETPKLRPVCENELGSATPGIRINSFLSQFPARAAQSSICEPDLSWAMRNTGLVARGVATRSRCLTGPLADRGIVTSSLLSTCSARAVTAMGTEDERSVIIPPCAGGDERCFVIEPDPLACVESSSQLSVEVRGTGLAADETLTVDCEVNAPVAL